MKKLYFFLICLLYSVGAIGQTLTYPPPPIGAYINAGSGWNPWSAAAGFGALGFTPQPFGLYCQASAGAAWTPCVPGAGGGVTQLVAGTNITLSPPTGLGVVTITASSTAATAFSAITTGTNATALLMGTGGSLGTSGTGTITATAMPAGGLTGQVAVANGGTGAATSAANSVFGNFTAGIAAPGFSVTPVFSAATLTNFPTFNQNTTGSAAKWTTPRNLAGNSVDGSANVPFANAFIVQGTTDAGLSGAQFLGALATGALCNTTTTGVLSICAAAPTSVSNVDGTLTISPTTGAVVASLALGHANTWTSAQTLPSPIFTGTPDASGAAQFKLPVAAAYASLANGEQGYDTTNKNWHIWGNAVDNIEAIVPVSTTITNTHCAEWLNTAGVITLTDAGSACGSGGGAAFQVNGVALTSATTVNFQNSAATNGLTLTFTNPSVGNVQLGFTGTLTNAGLANSAITIAGTPVALGGSTSSFPNPGAIGGTTPSTGAFTTLSATNTVSGSATTSSFSVLPTWNTTGVVDAGIFENVTNTASGTGSLLIDLQIGSTSEFKVDKAGNETIGGSFTAGSAGGVGGTLTLPEGTAATGAASSDLIYGLASSHRAVMNNNAAGALTVVGIATAGTAANCVKLAANGIDIVDNGSACGGAISFPQTVAGTTNSGGILYFSSTTVLSSSAILNTNVLTKGGGAGGAPTNSLITDSGITATYTGTGGYVAPVFVANGTTAGFVDYPQGTTSSAVAPCNTATSICEQAPTAVTSYLITKPGAAPTNNFSSKTTTTAGVESFSKMHQVIVLTGSAYTNATTGFTNVASTTNLNFALDASTAYGGTCYLVYSASVATAGPKIQFTGPASPTAVLYTTQFNLVSSGSAPTYAESPAAVAFSTSQTAGTAVTATTNQAVRIQFGVVNGVNAGTLQLQAAANGVGTLTIQPGSYCTMQ